MITLTLITAGLVILCVIFHGSFLQKLGSLLFKEKKFGFPKISLFIFLTVLAHLIEILFFTVAYGILPELIDCMDAGGRATQEQE